MTLREAIVAHGRANLTEANDWYRWPVNPSFLPAGIVLPGGNAYAQNVALKLQLSNAYSTADDHVKQEITDYYIAKWGGIRRNTEENIRIYALDTPASLIARGSRGIASWSKALCIRCPNEYAIYDARVALSLNCLQIIGPVNTPDEIPSPPWPKQADKPGKQNGSSVRLRSWLGRRRRNGFLPAVQ